MTDSEKCRECGYELPPNHPVYFCNHACEVQYTLKDRPRASNDLINALHEASQQASKSIEAQKTLISHLEAIVRATEKPKGLTS